MILKKANTFFSDSIKGAVDYKITRHLRPLPPIIFHFPVTYRCNGRCIMCNIWEQSGKPELTIDEIEKMLQDSLFKTIKYVILTGGEPTLRNDLGEIAKLLVKYCPDLKRIGLTTNGLDTKQVIKTCKEINEVCKKKNITFYCSVSLDGLNDYHEKIRGIKKAFEKTAKTIFQLKELQKTSHFGLGTETVISKSNVDNVHALEKWFKENKLSFHFGIATYRKRNVNEELDFMIDGAYLQKYLTFLKHLKENGDWKYVYEFLFNSLKNGKKRQILCPFVVEAVSIDPKGNMYYCTDSKNLGNIYDKSPSEIYYDKKNIKYRKEMEKQMCPNCLQTCQMGISLAKYPLLYITFRLKNCRIP